MTDASTDTSTDSSWHRKLPSFLMISCGTASLISLGCPAGVS